MKKQLLRYWRFPGSRVLHKAEVASECHYFMRSEKAQYSGEAKPRGCTVCDECQRLAKK